MARCKPRRMPLGTIWEIPDELWRRIEPILKEFWPRKPTGRRVANWRVMLNAILFRMRSGWQWVQLVDRLELKTAISCRFLRHREVRIAGGVWLVIVADFVGL